MTDLEKIVEWLKTYEGYSILDNFTVDYTDNVSPGNGLFPQGNVELSRTEDVLGNVTVTNQTNFAIYRTFYAPAEDTRQSETNAQWVYDFQQWVQAQSVMGLAPSFGNIDARQEIIKAENGVLFEMNDGTAVYMVQLAVRYKKFFEKEI